MDAAIAGLAATQHGLISRRQLLEIGVDRNAIGYRLRIGRLHAVERGAYAVGHSVVSPTGRCLAVALSCGDDTLITHRSAGWLWTLRPTASALIEVTSPRRLKANGSFKAHRGRVPEDERGVVDGVPVTSVPRTLLDLATVLQPHQLASAINQAEELRLTDTLSLPQLLERYPGHRGTRALRAALEDSGCGITKSELEERFQKFLATTDLPRPEANAALWVGGRWIVVDCLWRAQRVALELDGRGVHDTAAAFESDRVRDRDLVVAGWTPVRVTWRQLEREPRRLEPDLRVLLTSARRATP